MTNSHRNPNVNTASRLALIEYYERRITEEQDQLDYMTVNSTWFRIYQTTQSGDVDITQQQKDGLRRAIKDYRAAIAHLKAAE